MLTVHSAFTACGRGRTAGEAAPPRHYGAITLAFGFRGGHDFGQPTVSFRQAGCFFGQEKLRAAGDGPSRKAPSPSIGSPRALTTRPSQPAEARTAPATVVTAARQPRRTLEWRQGHEQRVPTRKSHDLARNRLARRLNNDTRADRHRVQRPCDLDHQPAYADDAAVEDDTVEFADLLGESLHERTRRRTIRATMVTPGAAILTLYLPGPLIIASSLGARRPRPARTEGRVGRVCYCRNLT